MSEKRSRVLQDHRRRRKTLVPPLAELAAEVIEWENVHLPEHLWLGYLMRGGDVSDAATVFNQTCDILDSFYLPENEEVFLGYISDFGRIPPNRRVDALRQVSCDPTARRAFGDAFRAVVALYGGGPAEWLATQGAPEANRDLALETTRDLVVRLRGARSKQTIQGRMLGLNRLLKHERMFFSPHVVGPELQQGLASYPFTDADTAERVEQFVRVTMNMVFSQRRLTDWPSQFWKTNFTLFRCR